ncbi:MULTISPECIES: hypothetical protein [unclassified Bradyrhizobium]|uniref:hypothetical protein n=1 Tax=Bradyrhizobium sp. USDA 4541 TaxID=2817704 RepID=UPI0035C740C7|nr:hypothetical protein [Bradyrhizobium sp. USDA 4541]
MIDHPRKLDLEVEFGADEDIGAIDRIDVWANAGAADNASVTAIPATCLIMIDAPLSRIMRIGAEASCGG